MNGVRWFVAVLVIAVGYLFYLTRDTGRDDSVQTFKNEVQQSAQTWQATEQTNPYSDGYDFSGQDDPELAELRSLTEPSMASVVEESVDFTVSPHEKLIQEARLPIASLLPPQPKERTRIQSAESQNLQQVFDSEEPVLALKSGVFKLTKGAVPDIKEGGEHAYLQFDSPLNNSKLKELEGAGVEVEEYIHPNAYRVMLPSNDAVATVAAFDNFHAATKEHPADKIEPTLLNDGASQSSINDDATIDVLVSTRSAVSSKSINKFLQSMIVEYLFEFRRLTGRDYVPTKEEREQVEAQFIDTSYSTDTIIETKLPRTLIAKLAERPEVAAITAFPPEVAETNTVSANLSNIPLAKQTITPEGQPIENGSGIRVGIWDTAQIDNHRDINNLTLIDKAGVSPHSTHVAGTVAGLGQGNARAKGMAEGVLLFSHDFRGSIDTEIETFTQRNQYDLSNHSYGVVVGCVGQNVRFVDNVNQFGLYGIPAQTWDRSIRANNDIRIKAVGNDRGEFCNRGNGILAKDGEERKGKRTLAGRSVAKNAIKVGSVPLVEPGQRLGAFASSFSSFGPTNDGRLGVTVVAKGEQVLSTDPGNQYRVRQGTSMAAPVVTGGLAIVIKHFNNTFGAKMTASQAKAIVSHTADDWGVKGPDYETGFGLFDAKAAVDIINLGQKHIFDVVLSESGDKKIFQLQVDEGRPFKATIAWTDLPASLTAKFSLVNNINIKLIDPSGTEHLPWTMDLNDMHAPPRRGINQVDTVEQVLVDAPIPGTWQLMIEAPGNLIDSQTVSVVTDAPVIQ